VVNLQLQKDTDLKSGHYLVANMEYKRCPRCKVEKSLDDYYRRQDATHKRQTYCSPCMREYNKQKYKKFKKRKGDAWWL
jgi:hypothetical protein